MTDKVKWYQKDYGKIILSLIVFPWGLYLVWTSKEGIFQSRNSKIIMTVVTCVFLIFAFSKDASEKQELEENRSEIEKLFSESKIEEGLQMMEKSKIPSERKPTKELIEKYGSKVHERYFKLAEQEYKELTQKKVSYEKFSGVLEKAKKWGNLSGDFLKLEKEGLKFKTVGDTRKAYSVCKDAVKGKLNDPGSAEFEYGTMELLAANALVKVSADVNTPTESIFKIQSWVRAKNQFGALMKKNFYCEVSFSKETEESSVRKLNF